MKKTERNSKQIEKKKTKKFRGDLRWPPMYRDMSFESIPET